MTFLLIADPVLLYIQRLSEQAAHCSFWSIAETLYSQCTQLRVLYYSYGDALEGKHYALDQRCYRPKLNPRLCRIVGVPVRPGSDHTTILSLEIIAV